MDNRQIKKLLILIMTSLVWDINFRLTYKNNDAHMDLGDYPSLKFDPIVILIKNVFCCVIFLPIYIISKKLRSSERKHKGIAKMDTIKRKYMYKFERAESLLLDKLILYHDLNTRKKQIFFAIKIILLVIIIYSIEEIYFIVGNTHILDRLNVPKRNLGILITIFLFSSLLLKKKLNFTRHQLFPSLIVIGSSIFIIIFEATTVPRFKKLYTVLNFLFYMIIYILIGFEFVLIKYLTDVLYIDALLILFLKGIIGTIVFGVINIFINGEEFFYFFDKIFIFEYENLYEDFSIIQKIFYIITILILKYLKILIINVYSESHFLAVAMIADLFFFPLYLIEKFGVQKFPITTSSTFYLNIIFGVLNTVLLLIFNEIIELKFCGCNKDLNKNIEQRKSLEMSDTLKDLALNEIIDDTESEIASYQDHFIKI